MPPAALIDDMGVFNVGFLMENLGKDAGDLQYLRELVQNSIESIARAGRQGRAVVGRTAQRLRAADEKWIPTKTGEVVAQIARANR